MKISIKTQDITKIPADLLIVNLFEGVKKISGATAAVDKLIGGVIETALQHKELQGKSGEVMVFSTCNNLPVKRIAVVGLGKKEKFNGDAIRLAASAAIRESQKLKAKTVVSILHGAGGIKPEDSAIALVEGTLLGSYKFKGYKESEKNAPSHPEELIIAEKDSKAAKKIKTAVDKTRIWCEAENNARDLVNAPANRMTPTILATHAQKWQGRLDWIVRYWIPKN